MILLISKKLYLHKNFPNIINALSFSRGIVFHRYDPLYLAKKILIELYPNSIHFDKEFYYRYWVGSTNDFSDEMLEKEINGKTVKQLISDIQSFVLKDLNFSIDSDILNLYKNKSFIFLIKEEISEQLLDKLLNYSSSDEYIDLFFDLSEIDVSYTDEELIEKVGDMKTPLLINPDDKKLREKLLIYSTCKLKVAISEAS